MDTQAASIHMLLQICISIADDLRQDRLNGSDATAAKRAYLGCYFLSAALFPSQAGRARPLAYTGDIPTYTNELAWHVEFDTDRMLPFLVEASQFMEDVGETFQCRSQQALSARSQTQRLEAGWKRLWSKSQGITADWSKFIQPLQFRLILHELQKQCTGFKWPPGYAYTKLRCRWS
jgi:hypothetical protein